MTLGSNLIAGLFNSIWSALISLAVVPFYLKYLGIEAYGLIGIFVTIQSLLQLLDMGMASTINREVARCSASGHLRAAGNLLQSLAFVYWFLAAMIAILLLALAPFIAEYWLQSKKLSLQTITHALMLMGFVVACRWPIALYQGALIGAQRLVVSSGINITMITLGSIGAVAVLANLSPTIEAFFIWQAFIGLVYALVMRFAAWRIIGKTDHFRFDTEKVKSVWRFTLGMGVIGLTALFFTQMDKVILSRVLLLEEFGQYMLSTMVVSSLYMVIMPVFNVMYPRFSALVATDKTEELVNNYRMGTSLLVSAIFPITMFLVVFGYELVHVWTGDSDIALKAAPVIALLAIGSALHGVMHFPYALQLAYGLTGLPLLINILLMFLLVPLIIYFATTYGALGGALAWLVLHTIYLLLGTCLTHCILLKGLGTIWLSQDIAPPLILAVLFGAFGFFTIHLNDYSLLVKLMYGGLLALVLSIISVITSKKLRTAIQAKIKRNKKIAAA